MATLRVGRLNRKIMLQRLAEGQDENREPLTDWVDVAAVWANIAAKSGLETTLSDTSVSIARYSIRIRYRPQTTAAMRVMCGSAIYQINAVLHDEAYRQYTDLVCERLETANG